MNEVIVIKIKKKTFLILLVSFLVFLIIFFAVGAAVLFWYSKNSGSYDEDYKNRKIEAAKLYDEAKNYAMKEHIKHVDGGEKYCRNCNICNGDWKE